MKRLGLLVLTMALAPAYVFAIDGQVLINQSTVIAGGGFPYKITQPGSYKLTGNLVVVGPTNAIEISASNVTLDLNGFMISGPGQVCFSCATTWGVTVTTAQQAVTVRNGTIFGFGGQINGGLNTRGLVEDLILTQAPGATSTASSGFGNYSVVRHIVSDQVVSFNCPLVAVENSAKPGYLAQGTPGTCVLANNLGTIF